VRRRKGKVYYTQVPPPECLGRDTQELNKSGTLIRKNPAALSPAQVQALEAQRKKKIEDEERSKETAARTWRCSTRIPAKRTSRTRERARSRKRRAPSRTPRGSSPERRSAARNLKRKKSST